MKAALFAETAEVGKFAFLHVALRQPRIETIEAEENQLLDFGAAIPLPAGNGSPKNADGPE